MSAFVDNILQCFIFNSSLAKAEKGWGRWVVGGGLWVAVGGERRKKGRGKVGWSVWHWARAKQKTHGQKADSLEKK